MATETGYDIAVVLINRHEPEGEVAGRLLELAEEKDYDARVVEAQRGEHDAALSFRVPQDVAEAFNDDRAERWPAPEPGAEPEQPAPAEPDSNEEAQNTPSSRKTRSAQAKE